MVQKLQENELIDYLESVGRNGPHLNAYKF